LVLEDYLIELAVAEEGSEDLEVREVLSFLEFIQFLG
jgi:hypothetical protein